MSARPGSAELQLGKKTVAKAEESRDSRDRPTARSGAGSRRPAELDSGAPGGRDRVSAELELGAPGAGTQTDGPRGWYTRGRLPHFDAGAIQQHIIFRLADSLPRQVVERMEQRLRNLPEDQHSRERRQRIEDYLDAGHGSCYLADPELAALTEQALKHFDTERYDLIAWVIMPNHVHVLIRPQQDMPLARIVQSWKSYTARRIRERRAPARHEKRQVWQREYWDRFIRHEGHFRDVVAYIHRNPVQAGLCTRPEDWRWSSASRWAELELGAPGDS